MVNVAELKTGQRVYFKPDYLKLWQARNGLVKSIPEGVNDQVFVVYNCAGNWKEFQDYTAARTRAEDLYLGWSFISAPEEIEEDNEE